MWHNLCEAALSEVKAHSTCWATVLDAPIYDGPRAQTTLERWHQVHGLLDQGVDNADSLTRWIAQVRAADLPHLHAFTRGWTGTSTP